MLDVHPLRRLSPRPESVCIAQGQARAWSKLSPWPSVRALESLCVAWLTSYTATLPPAISGSLATPSARADADSAVDNRSASSWREREASRRS